MKRYTIVTRPDEVSLSLEDQIRHDLNNHGYIENHEDPDYVFVVGGDGTFIYAVHQFFKKLNTVRFYGIHTGTLGFYTDYRDSEYDEFMETFLNHEYEETTYPILQAFTGKETYYAVNEIRIENAARTQVLDVYVNTVPFEKIRGTGILVCTQLGSTAYNRSLGGAVIQEGLDLIEMCEIAGIHHSKYRSLGAPIIMKSDTVLDFYATSFKGALLGADADVYTFTDETKVTISSCANLKVRMLRGRKVSYYSRLKSLF